MDIPEEFDDSGMHLTELRPVTLIKDEDDSFIPATFP